MLRVVQCGCPKSGNSRMWASLNPNRPLSAFFQGQRSVFSKGMDYTIGELNGHAWSHKLPHLMPDGEEMYYLLRRGEEVVPSWRRYIRHKGRPNQLSQTDMARYWKAHVESFLSDGRPWKVIRLDRIEGPVVNHVDGPLEPLEAEARKIIESAPKEIWER